MGDQNCYVLQSFLVVCFSDVCAPSTNALSALFLGSSLLIHLVGDVNLPSWAACFIDLLLSSCSPEGALRGRTRFV